MAIVDVENISFTYSDAAEPSLLSISLRVAEGDFFYVLGGSPSGKSTLVSALVGIIPNITKGSFTGNVVICGENTKDTAVSDMARKVGVVFQDPDSQLVEMRVEDEI